MTIPSEILCQAAPRRRCPPDDIKTLIVIPTFNNRSTLREVVEGALRVGPDVLVVNDGSTDGGPDTLDGLAAERIDFPENRGKGAAIVAAAQWAYDRDFTHVITIDADGQHDPAETSLFIERIRLNPDSLIVGRRDLSGVDVPRSSRFGRGFSNFWTRIACGVGDTDSQSGFRAYPVGTLRELKCRARRYDFEVEILVRSVWAGVSLDVIDISVRYDEQTRRGSHFDMWWDNVRTSCTYTRLVTRNFMPWPHKMMWHDFFTRGPVVEGPSRDRNRLSLKRPLQAVRTLLSERSSPRQLAAAATLGILLGTLPLIACHSVAIIFCATRLRLNRLLALNVSHLCAPPFVPALAIELGFFVRNGRWLTEFSLQTLGREIHHRLIDYLIGSFMLAPLLALGAGGVVYLIAQTYQKALARRGAAPDG